MKHRVLFAAFIIVLVSISGCVSVAPPRTEYTNIPPLEKGWSRIFIAAGQFNDTGVLTVDLNSPANTGPVYINDQKVGSTAYKEYIAVDLLPGSYEVHWNSTVPDKIYPEKKAITLKADEIRYFTCDMAYKGVGVFFGLIGYVVSEYLTKGFITEKSSLDSKSKLVSYLKFNGSSESVSQKLRELQSLRKDGVITEDDFQKKKQQLLEKL